MHKSIRYGSVLSKIRILLLSNYIVISRVLGKVLKRRGYLLTSIKTPDNLPETLIEFNPRLVILDYNSTPNSSFKLCKSIKSNKQLSHIPVIILGDKDTNSRHIIRGLNAGAEDFLHKPFDTELFLARLRVILQRRMHQEEPDEIFKSGDIILNLTAHTVALRNKPVELAPKEFALLYFLMKRKGKVLSRRNLIENIWEHKYFENMRTVDVHIQSLRKKLGQAGSYIEAIEGIGYRLKK